VNHLRTDRGLASRKNLTSWQRRLAAIGLSAIGLATALVLAGSSARAQSALDAEEIELRVVIEERQRELEAKLEDWVNQNTGSFHLEGLRRFAETLAEEFRERDFEVAVEAGSRITLPSRGEFETGPTVRAIRAGSAAQDGVRLLLIGHYDTVFEPDSEFQTFERDPGNPTQATGPGVSDMTGGLLVLLAALDALLESDVLERAHITVLLNGDEEIGSLGSRPAIEAAAREADYGFVFESARTDGAMVRSRRGLGQFHLDVRGVAAHAGSAHERGRSAVLELAHKILEIEALTDYERGVTLNVGTIQGGSKRNIVPERAEAWIDVRYTEPEDGDELQASLARIAADHTVESTTTELWGTLHRPPKPAQPEVDALLAAHAEVARALGIALPLPVSSGGGTDGSLTAAVGLATLDSMGVVGGRAHTDREFVQLGSLTDRAVLAAALLSRLIRERAPSAPAAIPEASPAARRSAGPPEPSLRSLGGRVDSP